MYSNWGFDLAIIMARAASLSSRDTTTGTAEISQLAPETFTAANKAYRDSFVRRHLYKASGKGAVAITDVDTGISRRANPAGSWNRSV